jgi:ubiquinone/menaquinone biosynthesis C-methylase UbiE
VFDYDAELRRYQDRLWDALDIGAEDRVLDVGCGTGLTTRTAARAACHGDALGVDISETMVTRARELSESECLGNVRFECVDAESHSFPPERFSVGVSRFGTMFFADPVAAFANIARSLRRGAPFVQLVWQDAARQEWESAIHSALAPDDGSSAVPDAAFSLSDPTTVRAVLSASGFTDIALTELHEPICYGVDVAAARGSVLALTSGREWLAGRPDDEVPASLDRLEQTLAAYDTGDGVWFDSHAWLVTARRGSRRAGVAPNRATPGLPAKI